MRRIQFKCIKMGNADTGQEIIQKLWISRGFVLILHKYCSDSDTIRELI